VTMATAPRHALRSAPLGLRRPPLLTLVVFALTAATALAQAVDRGLLSRFERTPAELHGEWWRIGTALLVQDGGVLGAASNLAFLAVIGVVAEQILSRPRWLAHYLGVGLLTELVAYTWQPTGGGNSIAVCGLAGAVAVGSWRVDPRLPRYSGTALLVWCSALFGTLSPSLYLPTIVLSAAAVAALARRRQERHGEAGRWTAVAAGATGLALAAATNIHGAALLGGIGLALLLVWLSRLAAGAMPPDSACSSGSELA
jgi:membrane associated rhomboid family serine protease